MGSASKTEPNRINVRLDAARVAKLDSIRRATGLRVSEVVRRGIDLLYEDTRSQARRPREILAESGFIGSGQGAEDLSERFEEEVASFLEAKHGDR